MFEVLRVAVRHHLPDGTPVGNDEPGIVPFFVEDLRHQNGLGRGRYAVDGVKGVHEGGHTGFCGRLEGRQDEVPEGVVGKVCGVVVAAAFYKAVAGKVLGAGRHCAGAFEALGKVCALETAHPRFGNAGTQPRILAAAFHDPAPAGVAGNVDHGGKGPVEAVGGGFYSGVACGSAHEVQIPGGGFAEGNGELRAVTVDDVGSKQEGDAQAGLGDGDGLEGAYAFGALDVEDGAESSGAQ